MAIGPFIPSEQAINSGINQMRAEHKSAYSYQSIFGNRFLDQRSRISFHYPKAGKGGDDTIVFLPFYENPTIVETQAANYGTYNIIGRGSSLFSYLGSGSRKIKVSMYFTLPHLAMHEMGISRFMRVFYGASKEQEKDLFLFKGKSNTANKGDIHNSLALAVEKEYWTLQQASNDNVLPTNLKDAGADTQEILAGAEPTEMIKIIDTLLFFISLLRTSVVNNAENPLLGPPLLRLSFGTLYQAVPCICKSYKLAWEEDAGYHMETLTPRRLKVDITLEEVRVGDFGRYIPGRFQVRDNLAGWEATLKNSTTDPLPQFGVGTPGN